MRNTFTSNKWAALVIALALGVFSVFAHDAPDQRGLVPADHAPAIAAVALPVYETISFR